MTAHGFLIVLFIATALAVTSWTIFSDHDPYGVLGFGLFAFALAIGVTWLLDI